MGVLVDIQPAWLYLDTRTLAAQFGYDRLRYFQPLHSLFEAGRDRRRRLRPHAENRLAPVGESVQPVPRHVGHGRAPGEGLRAAAPSRGSPDPRAGDPVLHHQQRPALFLEDRIGSLEAGKLADFVVIDRDLLTCPEDDIQGRRGSWPPTWTAKSLRAARLMLHRSTGRAPGRKSLARLRVRVCVPARVHFCLPAGFDRHSFISRLDFNLVHTGMWILWIER